MKLRKNQMFKDDYKYSLKQAAKGSIEHLKKLGITQKQALEMLQKEDTVEYQNVIFYLITVAREKLDDKNI